MLPMSLSDGYCAMQCSCCPSSHETLRLEAIWVLPQLWASVYGPCGHEDGLTICNGMVC